uniref:DUF577 domain-containing protein n=1 Tax=Heterorhabditis bacteriophora TaxID=37862 RepID=A0A1I7XRE4_HETBA
MSARFVLLMGMGEILSEVAIVDISESLFHFIKKYRPSGFDKIRKAAKTLFSKVAQTLEDIILIELEQRSRGNPQAWLDDVISSFSLCNAREINLIRFVVLLLSDGSELATKMCSWISDSFERMDWSLYPIVFNVIDVLCLIAENKGLRIDVMPILASLMNKMSLPGSGDLFVKRYCDLARSHSEYLMLIDINRAISSLRDFDVLIFFREMCDVEYEISGTAWNKAVTMLSCQKEDDSRLLKYIVHQIRVGLQRGSIDANIRLNCVIEKLNMKG